MDDPSLERASRVRVVFQLDRKGSMLVVMVPLLLVLLVATAATMKFTMSATRFAAQSSGRQRAFYVANGGLEAAKTRLYFDRATAPTSTTYTYSGTGGLGGGNYSYVITTPDATTPTRKTITSTGTVANSTASVVEQVGVFAFSHPSGTPTLPTGFSSNSSTNPLCDWAIFADTGTAAVTNVATAATALLNNGGVHSNNTITISNVAGAAVSGSGRFESVNATSEQASATILTPLNLTLLGNTAINLYYGASNLVFGQGVIDLHLPLLGPVAGIHFANVGSNKHGQQMAVSSIAFPILDFDMIRRRSTTTPVDANNVPPFGAFVGANDTGTWVVSSGSPSAPSGGTYFVRGNVQFSGFSLAQGTNTNIIATGTIEIDQLSLIQTALIGSTQSLRLAAKGNVYVGRQMGQTESAALTNLTSLSGLTVGVVTTNKIAAYSLNDDVWLKLAGITTGAVTQLNLVGKQNATLATTAAIVSAPTTYCQPLY